MRPILPTVPIISGVAMATSKSVQPPLILSTMSSAPTNSAPAASASLALSPLAKTKTDRLTPVPCGSTIALRICWSAWRVSMPNLNATSTDSSKLALAYFLMSAKASSTSYSLLRSTSLAFSLYFLPCFAMCYPPLWYKRLPPPTCLAISLLLQSPCCGQSPWS